MTGQEFLERLKRLAKARGVDVRLDAAHGKGSHGTLYFGDRFTRIKDRRKEIGEGLLASMCRDLGIRKQDLFRDAP